MLSSPLSLWCGTRTRGSITEPQKTIREDLSLSSGHFSFDCMWICLRQNNMRWHLFVHFDWAESLKGKCFSGAHNCDESCRRVNVSPISVAQLTAFVPLHCTSIFRSAARDHGQSARCFFFPFLSQVGPVPNFRWVWKEVLRMLQRLPEDRLWFRTAKVSSWHLSGHQITGKVHQLNSNHLQWPRYLTLDRTVDKIVKRSLWKWHLRAWQDARWWVTLFTQLARSCFPFNCQIIIQTF